MEKIERIRKITELQREMAKTMRRHAAPHWVSLSLSSSQVKALFCIVDNESISSKKLAEIFEVTPANITGIINGLINQGMVQRVENARDRRVIFLEPTQEGKNLIENLEQHAMGHSVKMLSVLDEDELNHLYLGMKAFIKAANAQKQDTALN
jgi:DNA-binding MarR family transcriptional regulator